MAPGPQVAATGGSPFAVAREAWRRDPLLTATALLHVLLFLLLAACAPFDTRTLLGLNPWIKPIKFSVSIAIYLFTMAWLQGWLPGPGWGKAVIRWGASISMIVEIVCIAGQSWRGQASHFNVSSALDGAIFGIMGLMIALNTAVLFFTLLLFVFVRTRLPAAQLWGARLGLVLVLLGSGVGGSMIANRAHSVGGSDGGPGLPFVNWSTEHGDLRAAHAVGLHGLQLLPLAGFLVARRRRHWSERRQVAALIVFAVAYGGVGLGLYQGAMSGQPLVAGPATVRTPGR